MLEFMKRLRAGPKFVDDMFSPAADNALNANENLINKQKCMTKLLYEYLSEGKISKSFTNDGKVYSLQQDIFDKLGLFIQQRKPNWKLTQWIKSLSAVFEKISVGNLVIFLEKLLAEQPKICGSFGSI